MLAPNTRTCDTSPGCFPPAARAAAQQLERKSNQREKIHSYFLSFHRTLFEIVCFPVCVNVFAPEEKLDSTFF